MLKQAIIFTAAVVIAGCDDMTTNPRAASTNMISSAAIGEYSRAPADVQIRIAGVLQPQRSINVIATARGLVSPLTADLTITAPELEAAKISGWDRAFNVPVSRSLPNLARNRVHLSVNTTETQTAVFRVFAPGYYRVVASLKVIDTTNQNALVHDAIHKVVWLWITDDGGKITDQYDETLFPAGVVKQPGPFRRYEELANTTAKADAVASSTGVRFYQVLYYNNDAAAYKPLRQAFVSGDVQDPSMTITPFEVYTDQSGYFNLDCSSGSRNFFEVDVEASNSVAKVGPGFSVGWHSDISFSCASAQIITNSDKSHVFENMIVNDSASRSFFGRGRSQLTVDVADCPSISGWSCYDPLPGDKVYLDSGHVWGNSGIRMLAHEYGHAMHETTFRNVPNACSGPLGNAVYTTLQCAFQEGFADYFSAAVRPSASSVDGLTPNNHNESDPNNPNGARVSGPISSFLWNLTDPVATPKDPMQLTGTYIGDIMATCEVTTDGANYTVPDGIDHIIYCLENAVDTNIASYFYGRSTQPTGYRESASEPSGWSAANIRTTWKWDLYLQ